MSNFQIEKSEALVLLRLTGELTIEHAKSLHTDLATALDGQSSLHLDASEAMKIDASVLQVIAAAAKYSGGAVLDSGSAAWSAAIERYGLNPFNLSSPQSS